MKIYLVGGAVRDHLLGLPIKDRDYVVVGANPAEMLALGYRQVGNSFPVFIHPISGHEYALARREKKIASGHTSFAFDFSSDITLEEDLIRRDLTINAIAMDEASGEIFDPYDGKIDLARQKLKHISEHFVEDPLRVLRVARFQAGLPGFTIDPTTLALMQNISRSNELKSLSGERIFMELKKALNSSAPQNFFQTLRQCHALEVIFPEIFNLIDVPQSPKHHPEGCAFTHTMLCLENSAVETDRDIVRFAVLTHDFGKAITPKDILPKHYNHDINGVAIVEQFCNRLKTPFDWKKLATSVTRYHQICHKVLEQTPQTILTTLKHFNALKNDEMFFNFLSCCRLDTLGKTRKEYPQEDIWKKLAKNLQTINYKKLAAENSPDTLAHIIEKTQLQVIKNTIEKH